jgi:hypothetical protein
MTRVPSILERLRDLPAPITGGALVGVLLIMATVFALSSTPGISETYECRRAMSDVTIDGRADEPAWQEAVVLDDFRAHWAQRGADRRATRARLLWDDENLYFLAEMRDHDLTAPVDEHDGELWKGDVFEIFLKPFEQRHGYYELEVNPRNAVLDLYLPERSPDGYRRWRKARDFHLETAVALRGTLDNGSGDEGWTVEGRIPWTDFSPTGGAPKAEETWRFALCRYDHTSDGRPPNLTSTAPLRRPNFHLYEDYTNLRFDGD